MFFIPYLLNHAFIMTGSFLPPYTREENFHLDTYVAPGIKPGPPALPLSALSIIPWPLGPTAAL